MKIADYLILGAIFLWLLTAVISCCYRKRRKGTQCGGGCQCGEGDCGACASSCTPDEK